MATQRSVPWFAVREDFPQRRKLILGIFAFIIPLATWCLFSYVPFLWHPMMHVTDPGEVSYFQADMLIDREIFLEENQNVAAEGREPATGIRANPIYLPAPHEVVVSFYTAFKTPPLRRGEPWLHESLLHSIRIIFYGFMLSCAVGVPLGILCGTFCLFSRLIEPFVDFIRYMPAPAFGALTVAVLGINDAPKVAIIFIGTFFQMVLVVSNTTQRLDRSLLEAAQTLGAAKLQLLSKVIIPGILPNLYRDLRILLGWAWTYLIIAELIGASSGISYFINQQAKYRNYSNVFAAIIMIGMIGVLTDFILAQFGRRLFPWQSGGRTGRSMIEKLRTAVGADLRIEPQFRTASIQKDIQ